VEKSISGLGTDGIWPMAYGELRITFQGVEYRILYIVEAGTAVLLHGFVKKSQETPKRALDLARERIANRKEGT
jgi:phage-related protein